MVTKTLVYCRGCQEEIAEIWIDQDSQQERNKIKLLYINHMKNITKEMVHDKCGTLNL